MAETATDPTTTDPTTTDPTVDPTTTTEPSATDDVESVRAELEKWKANARKNEERAKANAAAAKELEALRTQSMSDQERAVAEARAQAHAEGIAQGTEKIVRAELKAAAAGRLTPEQTSALLEGVNLRSFVDDEGEVDEDKVTRFVDGIAPPTTEPNSGDPADQFRRELLPDLGQGGRGAGTTAGTDPLLDFVKSFTKT